MSESSHFEKLIPDSLRLTGTSFHKGLTRNTRLGETHHRSVTSTNDNLYKKVLNRIDLRSQKRINLLAPPKSSLIGKRINIAQSPYMGNYTLS